MNMELERIDGEERFCLACVPGTGWIASEQDALDLLAACGEAGTDRLLIPAESLPPAFYDLSSGLAGAILLKFSNYYLRVAAVLTPELVGSGRFSEMAGETRRSRDFRIYYERQEAIDWLLEE
ncbi:MAG: DUF4180 domain-containing protein [Anaerolineales bacterium]|nr:DUF4180 domain-containing protein [Anaerolineales bacterium]